MDLIKEQFLVLLLFLFAGIGIVSAEPSIVLEGVWSNGVPLWPCCGSMVAGQRYNITTQIWNNDSDANNSMNITNHSLQMNLSGVAVYLDTWPSIELNYVLSTQLFNLSLGERVNLSFTIDVNQSWLGSYILMEFKILNESSDTLRAYRGSDTQAKIRFRDWQMGNVSKYWKNTTISLSNGSVLLFNETEGDRERLAFDIRAEDYNVSNFTMSFGINKSALIRDAKILKLVVWNVSNSSWDEAKIDGSWILSLTIAPDLISIVVSHFSDWGFVLDDVPVESETPPPLAPSSSSSGVGGGGGCYTPYYAVLANTIDVNAIRHFNILSGCDRPRIIHYNSSNYSKIMEKFAWFDEVLVFGGPKALEGVGEIVKDKLYFSVGSEKLSKMEILINGWPYRKNYRVFAGKDRNETDLLVENWVKGVQ